MGNSQQGEERDLEEERLTSLRDKRRMRCRGERIFGWQNKNSDMNAPSAKNMPAPSLVHEIEGKIITQIAVGPFFTCVTGTPFPSTSFAIMLLIFYWREEEGDVYEWSRVGEIEKEDEEAPKPHPTRIDELSG